LTITARGEFIVLCSPARWASCKLQLLLRLLEQAGDVLRAEKVEDRALLGQGKEIVGRQFVAEDSSLGHVGGGCRALRHQRADGEALTGTQVGDGSTVLKPDACLHPHPATLHDVKRPRNAHLTRQNLRALG
jgi:hypothetical protein